MDSVVILSESIELRKLDMNPVVDLLFFLVHPSLRLLPQDSHAPSQVVACNSSYQLVNQEKFASTANRISVLLPYPSITFQPSGPSKPLSINGLPVLAVSALKHPLHKVTESRAVSHLGPVCPLVHSERCGCSGPRKLHKQAKQLLLNVHALNR